MVRQIRPPHCSHLPPSAESPHRPRPSHWPDAQPVSPRTVSPESVMIDATEEEATDEGTDESAGAGDSAVLKAPTAQTIPEVMKPATPKPVTPNPAEHR